MSKAGVSWPVQERSSDPVARFFQPGSKLSWHWNWNKNWDDLLPHTSKGLKLDPEFVPMIFAPPYFDNEYRLQDGHRYILGYNEPDMDNPAVAQLCTPEKAAQEWRKLAALRAKHGIKLVSPAVAHDLRWMEASGCVPTLSHIPTLTSQRFLSLLPRDERPDFLAIHVYTTTFEAFRSRVEKYWTTFGLPIWVTEFAMTNFDPNVPPPSSQQQVHDFMGQTTKWLDETDFIARYSWFGACRDGANLHGVHPFNRLMDERGELTALGHQYVNGGHD